MADTTSASKLWLPVLFTLAITIQTGVAIMCWECNSHYDRNCGDPFRNETFALTDCSQRHDFDHLSGPDPKTATVCRKIVQKVKNDYRFVRGCGYLSNERESGDCFKRAGTFNVLVQYCSCDLDGCNSAHFFRSSWFAILATTILSILMVVK